MNIPEPKKAVAYIRISDRKQIDGESPETQRESIRQYAERNNIRIVEWFYDEAKSGKNTEREKLKEMLAFARKYKGKIDYVIVYKMNRASRDMDSYIQGFRLILKAQGISIRSATEPVDDTRIGRMMEYLLVLLAQVDNDSKADYTVDNMRSLAQQGYWQHGPIIGYDACKVPNELRKPRPTLRQNAMAPNVKAVLERFSQADLSQTELMRYAVHIGLRSPSGKPLTLTSIDRLLKSPMYAGYVCDKFTDGELVDGKHQALISPVTYQLNQRILRAARTTRFGIVHQAKHDDYPLKRLLCCHNCLKPLYASAPKSGGGKHSPRYHCARPDCKGKTKSVKASEVHARFIRLLADIQPSQGLLRLYKHILLRQAIKEAGNLNREVAALRAKLNEIAKARTAANTKFSLDLLSKEERDEVVVQLNEDKLEVADELAQKEQEQTVQEAAIDYAVNFMENTAQLWQDGAPEHRRKFQSLIFKDGLILNTQTLQFGTDNISPLYRYVPNKKDLSETEKSHVVTPIAENWNLLREELLRWHSMLLSIQMEETYPVAI